MKLLDKVNFILIQNSQNDMQIAAKHIVEKLVDGYETKNQP